MFKLLRWRSLGTRGQYNIRTVGCIFQVLSGNQAFMVAKNMILASLYPLCLRFNTQTPTSINEVFSQSTHTEAKLCYWGSLMVDILFKKFLFCFSFRETYSFSRQEHDTKLSTLDWLSWVLRFWQYYRKQYENKFSLITF